MKTEQALLTKYTENKAKLDKLNDEKNEIRDRLAEILHIKGINEMIVEDDYANKWKIGYQQSNKKKVDYDRLLEEGGQDFYNEIVEINEVTSFIIRKAPKKKKDTLTAKTPKKIEKDETKTLPKGKIS